MPLTTLSTHPLALLPPHTDSAILATKYLSEAFEQVVVHNLAVAAQGPRFFFFCGEHEQPYDVVLLQFARRGEHAFFERLVDHYSRQKTRLIVVHWAPWPLPPLGGSVVSNATVLDFQRMGLVHAGTLMDEIHPNGLGHQWIARSLWEAIRGEGSSCPELPSQYTPSTTNRWRFQGNHHCETTSEETLTPVESRGFDMVVSSWAKRKSSWRARSPGAFIKFRISQPAQQLFVVLYSRPGMSAADVTIRPPAKEQPMHIVNSNRSIPWLRPGRGLPMEYELARQVNRASILTFTVRPCTAAGIWGAQNASKTGDESRHRGSRGNLPPCPPYDFQVTGLIYGDGH